MNDQSRVCLVDNDSLAAGEMASILHRSGYATQIFETAEQFLRDLNPRNTFCIIFNLNMPDLSGVDLQRILATREENTPIIFVAVFSTIQTSVQVMKAGAVDLLIKPVDPQRLLEAVNEAAQRHQNTEEIAGLFSQYHSLTEREKEVFSLVSSGLLNKQIAAQLGISEKTIKVHRGRVMRKLRVQSLAELVHVSEKLLPHRPFPSSRESSDQTSFREIMAPPSCKERTTKVQLVNL